MTTHMSLQVQDKTAPKLATSFTPARSGLLQRKCACGGSPGMDGECAECRSKRLALQRQSAGQTGLSTIPPIVHNVLHSPGQLLDQATRSFMEPRFGHDFSQVRVHTDAQAAESARAVNALAYTVGRDVVFGVGQYAPRTLEGKRLLAHELTHMVQQMANESPLADEIGSRESTHEREAEGAEYTVPTRQHMSVRPTASTPQLQRQKDFKLPEPILGRPSQRQPSLFLPGEDRELFPPNLSLDKRETKRVCLTFDDGPQPGTADVLDVLRDSGVSATFFLTGKNMESNQRRQNELVMRMLDEGHKIGNHTFTHNPEKLKKYEEAYGDLSNPANLAKFQENYEKNEQYFQTLLGWRFPGFGLARLPGDGRLVKAGGKLILVVATKGMGMAHVSWRFELGTAGSFAHLKVSPWQGIKGVAAEVSGLPRTNDIILLHDRHWAGKQSLLKATLEKLSSGGFSFGKLDASGTCR